MCAHFNLIKPFNLCYLRWQSTKCSSKDAIVGNVGTAKCQQNAISPSNHLHRPKKSTIGVVHRMHSVRVPLGTFGVSCTNCLKSCWHTKALPWICRARDYRGKRLTNASHRNQERSTILCGSQLGKKQLGHSPQNCCGPKQISVAAKFIRINVNLMFTFE